MTRRSLPLLVTFTWACATATPPPSASHQAAAQLDEPQVLSRPGDLQVAEAPTVAERPVAEADDDEAAYEPENDQALDQDRGDTSEEELDDGGDDDDGPTDRWQDLGPHPLDGLNTKQLAIRLREDLESLGAMSIGRIHGGALINGQQLPEGESWVIRQPQAAWGTPESIDGISRCIEHVNDSFEETPRLYIGHLSRKNGGRFPPHVSHQNGRDVDLGYYYNGEEGWYTRANEKNLDIARTWSLVRCFVTETDVELILTIHPIAHLLRDHALSLGEDPHWLDQLFGGRTATMRPLIRHASGHGTHLHVRFYSPIAQETGRRMYDILTRAKIIQPPTAFRYHRARKGHTLAYLARRYRTSQRAIKRANRLKGTMIREGKVYRIPRAGVVKQTNPTGPVKIPYRRLPPRSLSTAGGGQKAKAAP